MKIKQSTQVAKSHFDRVIIQELAWEIAQAKADEHPEKWGKDDDGSDSSMGRTVVTQMNYGGWPADGIPGLIPLILKMLEGREIEAFSTFNELPCTDFELVKTNPAKWFISGDDANLVRDAMQLDQFTVKSIGITNTMNRNSFEIHQKALADRRALGRYTLEEAAIFISEATGSRPKIMQSKLMEAAITGALKVYEPGKNDRYQYGGNYASKVRNSYEEAKSKDLNAWLKINEPDLDCEFPDPSETVSPLVQAAPDVIRISVTSQQNDAILNWLKSNKRDPLKLPVAPSGKAGVKKECGDTLRQTHGQLFQSKKVFDTAWQRLRDDSLVKDEG